MSSPEMSGENIKRQISLLAINVIQEAFDDLYREEEGGGQGNEQLAILRGMYILSSRLGLLSRAKLEEIADKNNRPFLNQAIVD